MSDLEAELVAPAEHGSTDLHHKLITCLSKATGVPAEQIDVREPFSRYGLGSLGAARMLDELSSFLGRPLDPTLAWEHPTTESLVRGLSAACNEPSPEVPPRTPRAAAPVSSEPIAIVGMACRLPGAPGLEAAWQMLRAGVEAVGEVPEDRWHAPEATGDGERDREALTMRRGGFLEQVAGFDAPFFKISPREAAQMDPQHRLTLELAWEALEDAGVPGEGLGGSSTGVFLGAWWSDYARLITQLGEPGLEQHSAIGQDTSALAGRVSYVLGLNGPSFVVNTACSSSLVAVHLAMRSLRDGESSMALAGGVNLILSPLSTLAMSRFGGLSPDGRCHTFSAAANGYVRGEGGGMVVLKRLSRALLDGDRIYATLRGSAVNSDGASNGLTAPNPGAQRRLLRDAYKRAGVEPSSVHYVEAHGTGTLLGDPIEAGALGAVLGSERSEERPLLIGSFKTNIGHLESAAGIAGLIKVVLSMRHGQIPPSLHFDSPNPNIPFEDLCLKVATETQPWPRQGDEPLRAGVSAFGFSGTNAHLVVEEIPASRVRLLPLEAGSEVELRELAGRLGARLELLFRTRQVAAAPDRARELAAICAAAARRAETMSGSASGGRYRAAIACRSPEELANALGRVGEVSQLPGMAWGKVPSSPPRLAFVFSGHGSHWPQMGSRLLAEEPAFRAVFAQCDHLVRRLYGWSPAELLLSDEHGTVIEAVELAQPLVFAVQVSLAALWRSWGIEPDIVLGQSIGEVAAAHVAGALDLESAVRVICELGKQYARVEGRGGMALVGLPSTKVAELLASPGRGGSAAAASHQDPDVLAKLAGIERLNELCVGVHASPGSCVVSGPSQAVARLVDVLRAHGVLCREVSTQVAFHSGQVRPLAPALVKALTSIRPSAARVPMVSTVTGCLIRGEELNGGYWGRNLAEPSDVSAAVGLLLDQGCETFLEVSPHPLLTHSIEDHVVRGGFHARAIGSLRRIGGEREALLDSLAVLYTRGFDVRWDRLERAQAPMVGLELAGPEQQEALPAELRTVLGGTQDAVPAAPSGGRRDELLVLSAADPKALREMAGAVAGELRRRPAPLVGDICYTAAVRRARLDHRLAVVGTTHDELADGLDAALAEADAGARLHPVHAGGSAGKVAFVFSGQGSQWLGMGRELLASEPAFREAIEACDAAIRAEAGWSLLDELLADGSRSNLAGIDVFRPTLFAMGVALSAQWQAWGVKPDAVIGHSLGEVAAAHVAGALSLEDAVRVICRQSRLLLRLAGEGAMALVELPMAEAARRLAGLEHLISIAACNSHRATVLSGEPRALDELIGVLEGDGVFCRRIRGDAAVHSPQVEPLQPEMLEALREVGPRPGTVPIYSTARAEVLSGFELDATYWTENVRLPVQLAPMIEALLDSGHTLLIEMSAHPVLLPAIDSMLASGDGRPRGVTVPSLRRQRPERRSMLESLGTVFSRGVDVDLEPLHAEGGRLVSLPSYPFQRQRYWLEGRQRGASSSTARFSAGADQSHTGMARAGASPLLGLPLESSVDPGAKLWEIELGLEAFPFLADHRVQDSVVLPATALVEMALAAARELRADESLRPHDLRIHQALTLREDEVVRAQVAVTQGAPGRYDLRVSSREAGAGGWLLHVSGELVEEAAGGPGASSDLPRSDLPITDLPQLLEEIQGRCQETADADACYAALEHLGLPYGPAFRAVVEAHLGQGEALARVRLPEGVGARASQYELHPVLLDAGMQLLLLARWGGRSDADSVPMLPVELGRVRVGARPSEGPDPGDGNSTAPDELWCHARLIQEHPGSSQDVSRREMIGEIRLIDGSGRVVAEVEAARFKALESGRGQARSEEDSWFLTVEWERVELLEGTVTSAAGASRQRRGAWLVLADTGGVGEALSRLLESRGEQVLCACTRRMPGVSLQQVPVVDPTRPGELEALLEQHLGSDTVLKGVVYLPGLDAVVEPDSQASRVEQAWGAGCEDVVSLVQALARAGWRESPRLWLVTRGAHPVSGPDEPVDVGQAPLWALGRVIANEHPELECSRIDLGAAGTGQDAAGPAGAAAELLIEGLVRELLADGTEDEVALRHSGRWVARLVPADPPPAGDEVAVEARGRAFRLDNGEPGNPGGLRARAAERRRPGPGEVEIEVYAVGLSAADVAKILGTHAGSAEELMRLGTACAGRVLASGDGVESVQPGQNVVAALAPVCLAASHVVVPAQYVVPRPASLGADQAAAVPVAFTTAWYALHHLARVRPGERVLIRSGAGDPEHAGLPSGVDLAAVQIARQAGAEVLATAGTAERRELLGRLGAAKVLDSRSPTWAREVLEATDDRGVDVVLGAPSIGAVANELSVLAADGQLVDLGSRAASDPALGRLCQRRRLSYSAVDMAGLAAERPERFGQVLREVMEAFEQGLLEPVPGRVLPISRAREAVLEDRTRHEGSLVLRLGDPALRIWVPVGDESLLVADATYLVTGGLGGLGLAVARWMVDQGARFLVLASRRGLTTAAQHRALEELRAMGAQVEAVAVDVADRAALGRLLEDMSRRLPALRGVIHAAGVLEDSLLVRQSRQRLRAVMAPKVLGAWNLHQLTRSCELDLFVLYSSITSLLGSPGQGGYVAANAFLDALAGQRRSLGLPALSIAWGAFSEVGMAAASADRGDRLSERGLRSLTPEQGTRVLGRLLQGEVSQMAVAPLDVRQWIEFYPQGASSSLLARLVEASRENAACKQGDASLRQALCDAGPGRCEALLEDHVCEQVARVIRTPADGIDPETPFKTLGIDSLMGLELRNRLEAGLGMTLSATLIWTYSNVRLLAGHLAQRLAAELGEAQPEGRAEAEDTTIPLRSEPIDESPELAEPFSDLSDDDLLSALSEELTLASMISERDQGPENLAAGRDEPADLDGLGNLGSFSDLTSRSGRGGSEKG